jgi:fructose-1,6-bisphosphatase I
MSVIKTVQQHILDEERLHPEATGDFTSLLTSLIVAAKIISRDVNRAGLAKTVLGETDSVNVYGETVMKLDEFADSMIYKAMANCGMLCAMASEESDGIILLPEEKPRGKYVLLHDPLDGSSNIDVNTSIGTIFSIHRRVSAAGDGTEADCLQPGSKQLAAGYFIYGSSTMMVYTTGNGVHGFTLDPALGEFLLSHEHIRTPKKGKIYSINEGNQSKWDDATRSYVRFLKEQDSNDGRPYSMRYIGSLVADFHRNLLKGGIFLYPGPKAKLRLLYEAAPLALVAEQAGGLATTGSQRILDVHPDSLQMRVPLIIGSHDDVLKYQEFVGQELEAGDRER